MPDWLDTLYLICAAVGGAILVVQTILLAVGGGLDADADAGAGAGPDDIHDTGEAAGHTDVADSFFKLITFKTLVAFVTFFGLGGLACTKGGMGPIPSLAVALGAGAIALYLVGYLMGVMARLQSKGNLNLENAVGQNAKVYLRVPGERSGQGKVTVAVQGRSVECKAVTAGPEIPTGAEVRVVGMTSSDTLEVLPLGKE